MANDKDNNIKSTYVFHDIKFGKTADKSSMFSVYLYNDMVQFTIARQDPETNKFSKKDSIYLKGILDNGYAHFFRDLADRYCMLMKGEEVDTGEVTIKNKTGTIILAGGLFHKDDIKAVYIRIKRKENKDTKEFTLNETHYFGGARVLFRYGDPKPTDNDVYLSLDTFALRFQAMAAAPDIKPTHYKEGGFDKGDSNNKGSEGKSSYGGKSNSSSSNSSSSNDSSDDFPF